jgi:two-component response regulator (ARR-A family)
VLTYSIHGSISCSDQSRVCLLLPSILLQEIDVNLIITDYCMPGMTGYDLLKRVKVSEIRPSFSSRAVLASLGVRRCFMVHNHNVEFFSSYFLPFGIQGSSSLKDIPVVIMSSENVPARINR